MKQLLNKLYKLNRTLLSDDNNLTMKILQDEIPLKNSDK